MAFIVTRPVFVHAIKPNAKKERTIKIACFIEEGLRVVEKTKIGT
jgi:hypothetical protein